MPTRRLSGTATAASAPDNGGDHSGGGGSAGGYVDDVFSTYVYTGDNTVRDIENGIDLAGEGGMVWLKNRTGNFSHNIYDTERGPLNYLMSNDSAEENISPNGLSSFNSNGFTHGIHMGTDDVASWTFRKAPKFFDVVTYTGTGTEPSQWIEHNLGCVPGCIIIKRTDSTGDWYVYHSDLSDRYGNLYLNNSSQEAVSYVFDKTSNGITDTQFRVFFGGNNLANIDGAEYVAYLFAHDDSDESMIKCGSFTGSASGSLINLGFEPQWVMWKKINSAGNWFIADSMRYFTSNPPNNGQVSDLKANSTDAESGPQYYIGLDGQGFWEDGLGSDTYIYMAIRRPNKPAEEFDPEELFAIAPIDESASPKYQTLFVADMGINKGVSSDSDFGLGSRLTGGNWLNTAQNWEEQTSPTFEWDYQDGWSGFPYAGNVSWSWRRAPGFFDVVCYEGTNSTQTINHNLGVKPEALLIKQRTGATGWIWWFDAFGDNQTFMRGDLGNATITNAYYLNNTAPTDTQITLGVHNNTNAVGGDYIAYLFATVPGISKVGSYTGNGGSQTIDCGFTNGTRSVLIKRTNGTGDWYLCGIDGWLDWTINLNNTDAVNTNTANPLNDPSGFKLSSAGAGNVNISGAEYIFYAIA